MKKIENMTTEELRKIDKMRFIIHTTLIVIVMILVLLTPLSLLLFSLIDIYILHNTLKMYHIFVWCLIPILCLITIFTFKWGIDCIYCEKHWNDR